MFIVSVITHVLDAAPDINSEEELVSKAQCILEICTDDIDAALARAKGYTESRYPDNYILPRILALRDSAKEAFITDVVSYYDA
jgi:hypothetical protein